MSVYFCSCRLGSVSQEPDSVRCHTIPRLEALFCMIGVCSSSKSAGIRVKVTLSPSDTNDASSASGMFACRGRFRDNAQQPLSHCAIV